MSKPNAVLALKPEERPKGKPQERMTAAAYRKSRKTKAKRAIRSGKLPGPSPQDIVAAIASGWPAQSKLTIEIPTPPGLNHAYVNSVGHGRHKSPATKKFYADATAALATLGKRFDAETYRAHIVVTREHPRADIDGRAKLALDVLVKCGIIPDDRFCEKLVIEWRYQGPPGAVVMLDRYAKRRLAA